MKVIVDNKIPYIKEAIEKIADEVVFASGKDFTPELVKNADALIIRTRTLCDQQLLERSKVQFIATATIGYDHIDTEYCRKAGITWTNAPGCNAGSVGQYVISAILLLAKHRNLDLRNKCIGIVGLGHTGTCVAKEWASIHGGGCLTNDPPRMEQESNTAETFCDLKTIAEECDIITFHVPLSHEGKYKTFHIADEDFFRSLKKKPIIINASRGEVIDTEALLHALDKGLISDVIIDVWENEPLVNNELLKKACIATPHIAGYSADGKANATRMSLEALCRQFGKSFNEEIIPPKPAEEVIRAKSYEESLLKIYSPEDDSENLKAHPEMFEKLREEYPLRREKQAYQIILS